MNGRVPQESARKRVLVGHHLLHGSEGDDLTSVGACLGAKVDDPGCAPHCFLVMLDHEQRVSLGCKFLERVEESCVVTGVKSDRRFIQNVEHTPEIRSELGSETDSLGLATTERLRRPMEFQIVEADPSKKIEPLTDFRENVTGDGLVTSLEFPVPDEIQRIAG